MEEIQPPVEVGSLSHYLQGFYTSQVVSPPPPGSRTMPVPQLAGPPLQSLAVGEEFFNTRLKQTSNAPMVQNSLRS